ncbi:MAG: hypothetical protein Q4E18_02755 [Clostridia bacterium]|nr:hypothetical protein [Clostridia bacterium]
MATYLDEVRTLDIKGTVKLTSGVEIQLTNSDISAYSFSGSAGDTGLPLGATEANDYSLSIINEGKQYSPSVFDNAEVKMFCGLLSGDEVVWSSFGVWYVHSSTASEQSVVITLTGYDALASRFEAKYIDSAGAYPTTIGALVRACCTAAKVTLSSISFGNAAVIISKMPKWPEDVTLRDVIGYCAACAGGIARMTRDGKLEIMPYFDGKTVAITPNCYNTFETTSGVGFAFNCLEVKFDSSDDDFTRFAVDESIPDSPTTTIQVEDNPLFTSAIANSLITSLSELKLDAGTVTWIGDPSVRIGDTIALTTLKGEIYKLLVNSESFSFSGGLSASHACSLPATNTLTSSAYATGKSMFDPNGNIRVTRIAGFDQRVIDATVGYIGDLSSDTIKTDKLVAALIEAATLRAGSISADDVTTDKLTAAAAEILDATIRKLEAKTITTDELTTAFAKITTANIDSLTVDDITVKDTLAAALAKIEVLIAGTADFDFETVQHLIANTLVVKRATETDVFINNLQVIYAQIVQATVTDLIIKAADGNYYHLDVIDGNVIPTQVTPSEAEINAGEMEDGKQILITNIAEKNLSATTIRGVRGLIDEITAHTISVDDLVATNAFITFLQTANLASNSSLKIAVGAAEQVNKWFTFDAADGLTIQRPEYTDSDGVVHPASVWRTSTTETGFHIYKQGVIEPVGSFEKEQLVTQGVQVGDIVVRKTETGGWYWTDA